MVTEEVDPFLEIVISDPLAVGGFAVAVSDEDVVRAGDFLSENSEGFESGVARARD